MGDIKKARTAHLLGREFLGTIKKAGDVHPGNCFLAGCDQNPPEKPPGSDRNPVIPTGGSRHDRPLRAVNSTAPGPAHTPWQLPGRVRSPGIMPGRHISPRGAVLWLRINQPRGGCLEEVGIIRAAGRCFRIWKKSFACAWAGDAVPLSVVLLPANGS